MTLLPTSGAARLNAPSGETVVASTVTPPLNHSGFCTSTSNSGVRVVRKVLASTLKLFRSTKVLEAAASAYKVNPTVRGALLDTSAGCAPTRVKPSARALDRLERRALRPAAVAS